MRRPRDTSNDCNRLVKRSKPPNRKGPGTPGPFHGTRVPDAVHIPLDAVPDAAAVLTKVFGSKRDDFLEWLSVEIAIQGAATISTAGGPAHADVEARLAELEALCARLLAALGAIGGRELRLLVQAGDRTGMPFESASLTHSARKMREHAAVATLLAQATAPPANRPATPTHLVDLARSIAARMREAGAKPARTEGSPFVVILELVITAMKATWPELQHPHRSARALAGKAI